MEETEVKKKTNPGCWQVMRFVHLSLIQRYHLLNNLSFGTIDPSTFLKCAGCAYLKEQEQGIRKHMKNGQGRPLKFQIMYINVY